MFCFMCRIIKKFIEKSGTKDLVEVFCSICMLEFFF
ncbi:Uncharacterized protein BM_BM17505 [Brugia malayi]|uniref:Uncharacterized protein n=1 Tax=Brugia malayi TaxID=6279 RepID=A0A4E9FCQ4_BRUMA|nr:Uncharacterized protein BM_BM17505 [Brugia malayi]VIO93914.1 Uncharacterized protein BM_BM17505 [Brugia malayi]